MLCCLPGCPALLQGPSCCGLLPHIPWGCLPTVNSSLHRGTALNPYLQLPAIACTRGPASLSRVWRLLHGLSMQILPHSDHHRSAASLSNSLRCLCPAPNYCSYVGISPRFSSSTPFEQVQSHSPPLFPFLPSSYQVLCGSICSFLVVRDTASSQLVLRGVLCI